MSNAAKDKHTRTHTQRAARPFVFAHARAQRSLLKHVCIAELCILPSAYARTRAHANQLRPNSATAILSPPYAVCKTGELTHSARACIHTHAHANAHKVIQLLYICNLRVTQSKAMPITTLVVVIGKTRFLKSNVPSRHTLI
jgi:hypothetical protein